MKLVIALDENNKGIPAHPKFWKKVQRQQDGPKLLINDSACLNYSVFYCTFAPLTAFQRWELPEITWWRWFDLFNY